MEGRRGRNPRVRRHRRYPDARRAPHHGRRRKDPRADGGQEDPLGVRPFPERVAERKLAARLRARGWSLREIAERLGCSASQVKRHLKTQGPTRGKHDATILEMHRNGFSTGEIAAATGMSPRGVNLARPRLGIPPDWPPRRPKRAKPPPRGLRIPWLEQAQRMRARYATLAEIAAAVGVSVPRVSVVLSRAATQGRWPDGQPTADAAPRSADRPAPRGSDRR